jgi:predicted ferric reductase
MKSSREEFLMTGEQIRLGKKILLLVIAATVAVPPLFIQLDEPTTRLNVFKLLAKIGSLAGLTLMAWQFLLGFRGAMARLFPDLLWILGLHKKIGTYILLLIMLHPIFIFFFYLEKLERNLFVLDLSNRFDFFVLLGMISLALLLLVVISSLYRQLFKNPATWYAVHLTSYLLLLLAFMHSLPIGMTIRETGLRYIWWVLAGVLVLLALYRLAVACCLFLGRHRVVAAEKVGPQVTRIRMAPVNGRLEPAPGQFIFLRRDFWSGVRPFTVSHYDRKTGELSVSVKALGKMTSRLQEIQPGETVFIDGPYGVFAREALESSRPLVMIAGGIGITPFIRLLQELAGKTERELYLFYGNKFSSEIVYGDDIAAMDQVRIIHVLSDQPDYPGEKGFITMALLKKHLDRDLKEYEFLICGPPVMTEKLIAGLAGEGVPAGQAHYELFSY